MEARAELKYARISPTKVQIVLDLIRNKPVKEAEAILKIYQAQAEGIRLINESNPTKEYLTLQGYDALAKVANGQSTKIIIPSELQNIAGLVAGVKEIAKE